METIFVRGTPCSRDCARRIVRRPSGSLGTSNFKNDGLFVGPGHPVAVRADLPGPGDSSGRWDTIEINALLKFVPDPERPNGCRLHTCRIFKPGTSARDSTRRDPGNSTKQVASRRHPLGRRCRQCRMTPIRQWISPCDPACGGFGTFPRFRMAETSDWLRHPAIARVSPCAEGGDAAARLEPCSPSRTLR